MIDMYGCFKKNNKIASIDFLFLITSEREEMDLKKIIIL